jgi:DNA-directed RNA polymerase specialized sigma24 family protein
MTDADDVSQEIFLWLLRNRYIVDLVAMPWLEAVTRNFVLRHRARRALRTRREGEASRERAQNCGRAEFAALEARLALDQLEPSLSDFELRVVRDVRRGESLAKAVTNQGVPRGSRDWVRKRLTDRIAASIRSLPPRRSYGEKGSLATKL